MAIIRGNLGKDGTHFTHKCFMCGGLPTAFWHGLVAVVEVCEQCAIDTLPKLIVDATAFGRCLEDPPHAVEKFERTLKDVTVSFWKAAFSWASCWARTYKKIPQQLVDEYMNDEE